MPKARLLPKPKCVPAHEHGWLTRFIYGKKFDPRYPEPHHEGAAKEYIKSAEEFPAAPYANDFKDFDSGLVGSKATAQLAKERGDLLLDKQVLIQNLRGKISRQQLMHIANARGSLHIGKIHSIVKQPGTGTQIMEDIIDHAKKKGYGLITGSTISPAAEGLVKKFGFVQYSKQGEGKHEQKDWVLILGKGRINRVRPKFDYNLHEAKNFKTEFLGLVRRMKIDEENAEKIRQALSGDKNIICFLGGGSEIPAMWDKLPKVLDRKRISLYFESAKPEWMKKAYPHINWVDLGVRQESFPEYHTFVYVP